MRSRDDRPLFCSFKKSAGKIADKFKRNARLLLKSNRTLYILVRCLKSWHTDIFYKVVSGCYEENSDFTTILAEHNGDKYPDELIYHIAIAVPENQNRRRGVSGFFALLRWVLQGLNVADNLNAVPVVEVGANSTYYDPDMDHITQNVFEYYFEPVSDVRCTEIVDCRNVITFHPGHATFFMRHASSWADSYKIGQDEIERLGEVYKKYIRLNPSTDSYISDSITKCIQGKRTLGVHIRGTDFNVGYKSHPYVISTEEYLSAVNEVFGSGIYEQVFLATDDARVLEAFTSVFGDKLVYYADTLRGSDNAGVHGKYENRPCHYYKLGLEVLRDVYTLASCDSLVCGLSQVSFAARYVKLSKDESFHVLKIMDHGVKTD